MNFELLAQPDLNARVYYHHSFDTWFVYQIVNGSVLNLYQTKSAQERQEVVAYVEELRIAHERLMR